MSTTPTGAERVLVVDDEADILALSPIIWRNQAIVSRRRPGGTEALRAARDERPALIVLHLMLPGISGFDVLEESAGRCGDERISRCSMLTARREEPDRIRGLSIGADDYLTKPFSPQELGVCAWLPSFGGQPPASPPHPSGRSDRGTNPASTACAHRVFDRWTMTSSPHRRNTSSC